MDKTKLVKSKSSDINISKKLDRYRNRNSPSNVAVTKPKVVKKRGVYVERKPTKTSLDNRSKKNVEKPIVKAPPRRRPEKKKFLTSVLTILSKSTAGTQYPDTDADNKANKQKTRANMNSKNTAELNTKNDDGVTKKKTYRSKILNERRKDSTQVLVLRPKKEIVQTPSLYSEKSGTEEIKWSDFPRLVQENGEIEKKTEESAIHHCVADGISKIIENSVTKADEPKTLVSEKPKGKLYNFFVDLLETTFSVYNVNTEFKTGRSVSSSKIALQIEESVAEKLEVKKDVPDKQRHIKYNCIDSCRVECDDVKIHEHYQPQPLSVKLSQEELRLKPERKIRKRPEKKKNIVNTQSFSLSNKKSNRKYMKKNLMTLFKEQLKVNIDTYEEPENLYQALKVMARNKRKREKSTNFDSVDKYDDKFNTGCRFKGRKVVLMNKRVGKRQCRPESEYIRSITKKMSDSTNFSNGLSRISEYKLDSDESKHSLEVYGYEFGENNTRREQIKKTQALGNDYMFLSSQSDINMNENINYTDSSESL